jgi:hypothetical protein
MTRLVRADRRRTVLALAVAGGLAAAVVALPLGGVVGALAYLLPAVVLLLAVRRYPGERTLLALLGRRGRRRRPIAVASRRQRPRPMLPRGGRLLASSLAVRPPPALPAGS